MSTRTKPGGLETLPPWSEDDGKKLNVVIETPKGSRNKFAFDEERRLFTLKKVLPAGMAFPYDFGFVPSTKADDGDPLDVLVLMDEPAFAGCLVECRLIGVIEGEQTEDGERERNDRLIAVEGNTHSYSTIRTLKDLGTDFLEQLEAFFVNYHQSDETEFRVIGRRGAQVARELVTAAMKKRRRHK